MTPLLMLMLLAPTAVIERPIPAGQRLLSPTLPPALDGRLAFAYLVARTDIDPTETSATAEGLAVSIRLDLAPSLERAAELERAGCRLDRLPSGQLANVGTVLSGFCRWESLWTIAAHSWVKRIEPMSAGRTPAMLPVSTTGREVEATQLNEAVRAVKGGKGVVIADIDSGLDPFHPFLFRTDGGAFAWIDENANGLFDPGTDSVDFNRNGLADPGERLRILKAPIADLVSGPTYNTDAAFVPGVDWLFQDENADGVRNQGSAPPYGDLRDTFGEELYVADDVNTNGSLDVGERVVRLKTSKIVAALGWAPGEAITVAPTVTYRRGVNLSKLTANYPRADIAMHGTLVSGTLVGGTPGLTRYSGVAPDADLLVASYNNVNQIAALAWAKNEGAHIVNWELAKWADEFLDGSTNLEIAIDQATGDGLLNVVAAGNLASQKKHRLASHPMGVRSVPLIIPGGVARATTFSFVWKGGPLSFALEVNGVTVSMAAVSGMATAGTDTVVWGTAGSARATNIRSIRISAAAGGMIAGQTAKIVVTNPGPTIELNSYVIDTYSGWSQGVYWPEEFSDRSTLCTPSTADSALAVGSYRLDHPPAGQPKGALSGYSSQGPRIDGQRSIDLVAPEDHIASIRLNGQLGEMAIGSGTSNAAPVVAGIAALLKAIEPSATPASLRTRLRSNAFFEPQMGNFPSDLWGAGKIRAHQAANLGIAIDSKVPIARGTAKRFADRIELDAAASTDPEGEPLSHRWDLDYDGELEVGPEFSPQHTALPTQPIGAWVKLEVTDPHGRVGRVLIRIEEGVVPVVVPDAGPPDAGTAFVDAGTVEPVPDAGMMEPVPPPTGCGCSSGAAELPWLAGLFAAALARFRRRATSQLPVPHGESPSASLPR